MVQLRTLGETLVRRRGDSGDEALYLQPKRLAVLAYWRLHDPEASTVVTAWSSCSGRSTTRSELGMP